MIKKIIVRIFALAVIITALNFLYYFTLYETDLKKNGSDILEIKEKQSSTDIYYFGESSDFTVMYNDSIKNSISEMTNFFYPKLKLNAISKPAVHGGIFKQWLAQIEPEKSKLKAVVVTLNLRSFDATWIYSGLESKLQQSVAFFKLYPPLINRFCISLNSFDEQTEQQLNRKIDRIWRKTPLKFPFPFKYKNTKEWDINTAKVLNKKTHTRSDSLKVILACHYIKAFAFNLNEQNPRVMDFDEIKDWCEKRGIKLYLNLMAENVEYADSLVGKELVFLMKNNRDYLVKRYNDGVCKVVDNLELVKGKEYIDQDWTTEHYSYKGRMIIAKNLANALKEQFKNEYKEAY